MARQIFTHTRILAAILAGAMALAAARRAAVFLSLAVCARMEAALRAPHFAGEGGQTVVVTHHGPSRSTAVGQIDDLTPSFHSDLDMLILETAPDAWFFGHSHRRCQARVGRTDIRNVSAGYPEEGRTHALGLRELIFFETD